MVTVFSFSEAYSGHVPARAMRPATYQPGSIASPLAANSQSSCIAFESAAEDGMRSLHYVSLNIGEGARAASKGF